MVGDLQLNVVSFWHLMGDVYFHGRAVGMKDLILGQSFFFCRVKGRMTLDGKHGMWNGWGLEVGC